MRSNQGPIRWKRVALSTLLLTSVGLVGCGAGVPGPGGPDSTPSRTVTRQDTDREPIPQAPKDDNGQDVPTNIPQPIPNPDPPADPKALNVKAIANTVNINPLSVINTAAPSRISVYTTLVWSQAKNAAQYRVQRDDEGNGQFTVRANVPASFRGYQDGGVMNLKIGTEYSYLVEALDSSGRVIAKGTDKCKPIYPLPIPKASSPENNADQQSIQPEFAWGAVDGCDGYYVEVFSGTYLVPMWRGFRKSDVGTKIRYGDQSEMLPGTSPAIFAGILNPAGVYTWSVTAVKTDTGNAATAKAWAKSNSTALRFFCGPKPASAGGSTTGGN